MSGTSSGSYSQILKSSSLIGGTQGINLLVGMARTKCVALLIGPLGVGLVSTYQAIQNVAGTLAGLGIQSSAVREVADAVGTGDQQLIARTVLALRRISLLTGAMGAATMAALAVPLSLYSFGSAEHAFDIALLGAVVFFGDIQGGQLALLQGMRRIGDLARINVVAALAGAVTSVALYAWLGLRGIIPALVSVSALQLLSSWYFARTVVIPAVAMSWTESVRLAGGMARLGLAFMWNGVLTATLAYVTRTWIARGPGLDAVGIFTAAFALSGMFVTFVLNAMGADYYPRLTAASRDHGKMNRLVNEQTEIGLLLAVPGLLATLTLAPWIVRVFYTSAFSPASDLLQWFILGCLGQVISWPMGFVMLALGRGSWFAFTQTLVSVVYLGMIWEGLSVRGIEGISIAFFLLYVIYTPGIYLVTRHLTRFNWSSANRRLFALLLPLVALAFVASRALPPWPAAAFGLVMTGSGSLFCLRELIMRLGPTQLIARLSVRLPWIRWVCGLR